MKHIVILLISLTALLFSQLSCAGYYPNRIERPCHACRHAVSCRDSCEADQGCWNGCSPWGDCYGPCGSCNCTDPDCGRNPCISRRECCQVFGNIGAGDLDFPCDCA